MKIQSFSLHPYKLSLTDGSHRSGVWIHLLDNFGKSGYGEIAPLLKWSKETLEEALEQVHQKQYELLDMDWEAPTCLKDLAKLKLLPSVSFGVESALLSLLDPLSGYVVSASALLMGSFQAILEQAVLRHREGFTSAKLKVSNLTFEQAASLIHQLKDKFHLRIDVNRAWKTSDALHFFSQFPLDTFDYVEEPFANPHDLALFPHPLAVDESFPSDLSLEQLESLPTLKALIYKPTIQGGMLGCLHLHEWAMKRGIDLVMSSSFESHLGLAHVASLAHRLSLTTPVGIGTYHFLKEYEASNLLGFTGSKVYVPAQLIPRIIKE